MDITTWCKVVVFFVFFFRSKTRKAPSFSASKIINLCNMVVNYIVKPLFNYSVSTMLGFVISCVSFSVMRGSKKKNDNNNCRVKYYTKHKAVLFFYPALIQQIYEKHLSIKKLNRLTN